MKLLSIEWNSIRIGGPSHRIVTETVHKTLQGGGGDEGGLGDGGLRGGDLRGGGDISVLVHEQNLKRLNNLYLMMHF